MCGYKSFEMTPIFNVELLEVFNTASVILLLLEEWISIRTFL